MAQRDTHTLDLFEIPAAPRQADGALNCSAELQALLSTALKQAPGSRYAVAARTSELLGVEVSKHQDRSSTRTVMRVLPSSVR